MSQLVTASFTPLMMPPPSRYGLSNDRTIAFFPNYNLNRSQSMYLHDHSSSDRFGTPSFASSSPPTPVTTTTADSPECSSIPSISRNTTPTPSTVSSSQFGSPFGTSPSSSTSTLTSTIDTPDASTVATVSRNTTPTPTPTPNAISDTSRVGSVRRDFYSTNPFIYHSQPPSPTNRPVSTSPQASTRASTPLNIRFDSPLQSPTRGKRACFSPGPFHESQYRGHLNRPSNFDDMAHPLAPRPVLVRTESGLRPDSHPIRIPPRPITSDLHSMIPRVTHPICARHGWTGDSAQRISRWARQQPRTALLLLMCEDSTAWKLASFYNLEDEKMPFKEENLVGIVADTAKVIEMQWKVAFKGLPKDGGHINFRTDEILPLEECGQIGESKSHVKTLDKVHYMDSFQDAIFARKRFEFHSTEGSNDRLKAKCLSDIGYYKELDYDNIVKIASSYMQGQVLAFTYPYAEYNLAEYLLTAVDLNHNMLLRWIVDLADALTYIHSKGLPHSSIRPQKILIEHSTNKILFSPFGITPRARNFANAQAHSRFSTDPSYVYAAPELKYARENNLQADVFSLGCCFLDMLTVAKGIRLSDFTDYRSRYTKDLSFQANPDTVSEWIEDLRTLRGDSTPIQPSTRVDRMLTAVKDMLHPDPTKRPSMEQVVNVLKGPKMRTWSSDQSFAGGLEPYSPIWREMRFLQPYYREPSVYGDY